MAFTLLPFSNLVGNFSNLELKNEFEKKNFKKLSKESRAHLALMIDTLKILSASELDNETKSKVFTGCILQIIAKDPTLTDDLLKTIGIRKELYCLIKDKVWKKMSDEEKQDRQKMNEAEIDFRKFRIHRHIHQKAIDIPKFDALVEKFNKACEEERKKHGVHHNNDLPEPRRSQLIFMTNVLEVAKKMDSNENEKSFLLLGAMLKVYNDIKTKEYPNTNPKGTLFFPGSKLYIEFSPILEELSEIDQKQAMMTLRNFLHKREATSNKKLEEKDISIAFPVMTGVSPKIYSYGEMVKGLGLNKEITKELEQKELPKQQMLEKINKIEKKVFEEIVKLPNQPERKISVEKAISADILKKHVDPTEKNILPKFRNEMRVNKNPYAPFKKDPIAFERQANFYAFKAEVVTKIRKVYKEFKEKRDQKQYWQGLFSEDVLPKVERFKKTKLEDASLRELAPLEVEVPVLRRK